MAIVIGGYEIDDAVVMPVVIARNFQPLPDDMVIARAAVYISIDPITGCRQIAVFTDDGHGNGDHIVTVHATEVEVK